MLFVDMVVLEVGLVDFEIVKLELIMGCLVVIVGGMIGLFGICGLVGFFGFGVVGVLDLEMLLCRIFFEVLLFIVMEYVMVMVWLGWRVFV